MVTRIARRLALKEETVWARMKELRAQRRGAERAWQGARREARPETADGRPAAPGENGNCCEILAGRAGPGGPAAAAEIRCGRNRASGACAGCWQGLYALQAAGSRPTLDLLRVQIDERRLMAKGARTARNRPGSSRSPGLAARSGEYSVEDASAPPPSRNCITSCTPPAITVRHWESLRRLARLETEWPIPDLPSRLTWVRS